MLLFPLALQGAPRRDTGAVHHPRGDRISDERMPPCESSEGKRGVQDRAYAQS